MKKKKLRCTKCGKEFYSDRSEELCPHCGGRALIIEETWEILFSYVEVKNGSIKINHKKK